MASMETHIIRAKQKRRWREHTAAQRRKRARRDRQERAAACCALALGAALGFAWAVSTPREAVQEPEEIIPAVTIEAVAKSDDAIAPSMTHMEAVDTLVFDDGAWNEAGEFRVYHYCPCAKCCGKTDGVTFTGTQATAGRTVSVDPKVIPLGSEVLLNGQVYIAEDTGVHGRCVDVFVEDHREALRLGTYVTDVKWRADG